MNRTLLLVLAIVAGVSHAAVSLQESTSVNLVKGSTTVAPYPSWDACRTAAVAAANAATATSGVVTYTCQTERRQVVATYSPNTTPPPPSGGPLDPAQTVSVPSSPAWSANVTKTSTNQYAKSPLYTLANGQQVYVRSNAWNTGRSGFASQLVWANGPSDWGVTAVGSNDGQVHAYPSEVCGWATGEGVRSSCVAKPVSALTKLNITFNWQGPANCSNGVRTNVLLDTYLHTKAAPGGDDLPSTSVMLESWIDCDGWYGSDYKAGTDLTVGTKTYRISVGKQDWASGNTIRVAMGPATSDWTVGGSKTVTIDYLALLQALAAKGYLKTSEYVTSIQGGFETLGGGSYKVTAFNIDASGIAPIPAPDTVPPDPVPSGPLAFVIYQDGSLKLPNDYSFGGLTANYRSTACAGPGHTYGLELKFGQYAGWQPAGVPVAAGQQTPWANDSYKALRFDLRAPTGADFDIEWVSSGDTFDNPKLSLSKYGATKTGEWVTFTVPFADSFSKTPLSLYKFFLQSSGALTACVDNVGLAR
jgi:hypothetical protein